MNTPNLFSVWQKKDDATMRIKITSIAPDELGCTQITGFSIAPTRVKTNDLYNNLTEVYLPQSIYEASPTSINTPTPWPPQHSENHELQMPELKRVRI